MELPLLLPDNYRLPGADLIVLARAELPTMQGVTNRARSCCSDRFQDFRRDQFRPPRSDDSLQAGESENTETDYRKEHCETATAYY